MMKPKAVGFAFLATLGLAAGLRLAGIGWGIPRYDAALAAGTAMRTSWHPDEDRPLWALVRTGVLSLSPGPDELHWASLHTRIVGASLAGADLVRLFPTGWRTAFATAADGFATVFVVGRLATAAFGVATVAVVFWHARELGGPMAGLAAAGILAVSPLHVVQSQFLTADVPLAFWVALACALAARGSTALAGLVLGVAVATKPVALVLVPMLVLLGRGPSPRRHWSWATLLLGFALAQPAALFAPLTFLEGVTRLVGAHLLGTGLVGPVELVGRQAAQVVLYGAGPVATFLAIQGCWAWPRLLAVPAALLAVASCLSWLPVARYVVPLLPLLAVAAGVAWASLRPSLRGPLAAVALVPPIVLSAGHLGLMREPHTAQRAADWTGAHVAAGSTIAQMWPEYPLLSGSRYRLLAFVDPVVGSRPYERLTADVVVVDDLGVAPWRRELRDDIAENYVPEATFAARPHVGPFAWDDLLPAHDWKYTHPTLGIWRRR